MSFRVEFPDFPAEDMPTVPAPWKDISWHNDTCPSFEHADGFRIFVDYADHALREWPEGGSRYTLYCVGDEKTGGMGVMLATDSWVEMTEFLAEWQLL